MGDNTVQLIFFLLLHLSKKVTFQIDDRLEKTLTTKMETIRKVVDEIFEKQFPGQMIQVLSDDMIIRGKTRNWDLIMTTKLPIQDSPKSQ